MAQATRHLLELGHRRVGLVLGHAVRPSVERRRALERVYAEQGLAPTYEIVGGTFSADHGAAATRSLLDLPEPVTAIVAGGNQVTIGVLRALREREFAVGRDVSLVACDDIPIMELHDPPIAVVRRDNRELGRVAAGLLFTRMKGSEDPEDVVLPTEFVARASCARAPDRGRAGPWNRYRERVRVARPLEREG
jgi:LacI family transcriptional regulator